MTRDSVALISASRYASTVGSQSRAETSASVFNERHTRRAATGRLRRARATKCDQFVNRKTLAPLVGLIKIPAGEILCKNMPHDHAPAVGSPNANAVKKIQYPRPLPSPNIQMRPIALGTPTATTEYSKKFCLLRR